MIKILEFNAFGFEPVPWTVPNIGNRRGTDGKKYRFTTRTRKTDMGGGKLSLKDWQEFVRGCAKEAMKVYGVEQQSGPLHVHFEFFAQTPAGKRHGELWDVRVVWDKKKKGWVKKNRDGGQCEPDLTNLQKGTEDALNGVTWVDDCENRFISSMSFFGPLPGVRIRINLIEEGDYPGRGDPVA